MITFSILDISLIHKDNFYNVLIQSYLLLFRARYLWAHLITIMAMRTWVQIPLWPFSLLFRWNVTLAVPFNQRLIWAGKICHNYVDTLLDTLQTLICTLTFTHQSILVSSKTQLSLRTELPYHIPFYYIIIFFLFYSIVDFFNNITRIIIVTF